MASPDDEDVDIEGPDEGDIWSDVKEPLVSGHIPTTASSTSHIRFFPEIPIASWSGESFLPDEEFGTLGTSSYMLLHDPKSNPATPIVRTIQLPTDSYIPIARRTRSSSIDLPDVDDNQFFYSSGTGKGGSSSAQTPAVVRRPSLHATPSQPRFSLETSTIADGTEDVLKDESKQTKHKTKRKRVDFAKPWSETEKSSFEQGLLLHGPGAWFKISELVGNGRTPHDVSDYYDNYHCDIQLKEVIKNSLPTVKMRPESLIGSHIAETHKVLKVASVDEEEEESEINIDDDELTPLPPIYVEPEYEAESTSASSDDGTGRGSDDGTGREPETNEEISLPQTEWIPNLDIITEKEKRGCFEFFENRPHKTPERYMKIRNGILRLWNKSKPQYVSSITIRPKLRGCGDVNAITRVHRFLEQEGAINFGVERPFRRKSNSKRKSVISKRDLNYLGDAVEEKRPRRIRSKDGGRTFDHDDESKPNVQELADQQRLVAYNQKYFDEELSDDVGPQNPKRTKYVPEYTDGEGEGDLRLIHAKRLPSKEAPFSVVVLSNCLVLADLHAHLSLSEVIGLLGGPSRGFLVISEIIIYIDKLTVNRVFNN